MIELRDIKKSYRSTVILHDVSFEARPGELLCICGQSGSGKTLLLRIILATERPSYGDIRIDGVDLSSLPFSLLQLYRSRVGFVAQEPMLLPTYSIVENLALPLELRGFGDRAIQEEIGSALQETNLTRYASKSLRKAPASAVRLCAFVRGFLGAPNIILLDEPFSGMSQDDLSIALSFIRRAQKGGATIVLCTRDGSFGHALSARELHLHEGTIVEGNGEHRHAKPATDSPKHHVFSRSHHHETPDMDHHPRKIRVTSITSDLGE